MKPIKTIHNRPEISQTEIKGFKDFDSLQKKVKSTNRTQAFNPKWWYIGSGLMAFALLAVLLISSQMKSNLEFEQKGIQKTPSKSSKTPIAQNKIIHSSKILPPLPSVDVPFSHYRINNFDGGDLTHFTGSEIHIPKHAFIDDKGMPVNGFVDIEYREFHDPLDVWLSGIPMTYDTLGMQLFESAGMLEIRAYQNQKPLQLNPKAPLIAQMVSHNGEERFKVYSLDDSSGLWQFKGRDQIIKIPEVSGNSTIHGFPAPLPPKNIIKLETALEQHKQLEPKSPQKFNATKYTFDLDVDLSEFPEFAKFNDLKFEVDPNQKDFNSTIYNTVWDAAELSHDNVDNNTYTLSLQKDVDIKKYKVHPVYTGKDFKKAIEHYHKAKHRWQTKADLIAKNLSKERHTYSEKKAQWAADLKKKTEKEKHKKNTSQVTFNFIRTFEISQMGITNCDDYGPRYPKGKKKKPQLLNIIKATVITPVFIYIIEKGKNKIYRFDARSEKIALNSKKDNILWTLTQNNQLAVIRPEEIIKVLEATKQDEFYTLPLHISQIPLTTKEDIAQFLGVIDVNTIGNEPK